MQHSRGRTNKNKRPLEDDGGEGPPRKKRNPDKYVKKSLVRAYHGDIEAAKRAQKLGDKAPPPPPPPPGGVKIPDSALFKRFKRTKQTLQAQKKALTKLQRKERKKEQLRSSLSSTLSLSLSPLSLSILSTV